MSLLDQPGVLATPSARASESAAIVARLRDKNIDVKTAMMLIGYAKRHGLSFVLECAREILHEEKPAAPTAFAQTHGGMRRTTSSILDRFVTSGGGASLEGKSEHVLLHEAILAGNLEAVRLLLQREVSIWRSVDGETAMRLAMRLNEERGGIFFMIKALITRQKRLHERR